jgi:hypothetical protein
MERKKILINVPFFSQVAFKGAVDSNNKQYLLGNSNDILLWTDGCGVASLAMVYGKWGLPTCLPCLNESLKKSGGFSGALLRFDDPAAVAKAGAPFIKAITNIHTSKPQDYKEKVDSELAADRPVIVFINNAHFVVITGMDENGGYLVNDPWKKTESEGKNIPFEKNMTGLGFDKITQFDFVSPEDNAPTNGIVVRGVVRDAYFAQGGSQGVFGNPVSEDTEDTMFEDRYPWQKFEHGMIMDVNGEARSIYGPLWKKVQALGGLERTGLPLHTQYSFWSAGQVMHVVDLKDMTLRWGDQQSEDDVKILYPANTIHAEYFANDDLSGTPVYNGRTDRIQYDWGISRPIPWLDPDRFSIRWTGEIASKFFAGWWYTFHLDGEGRYRVYIDGRIALDAWDKTAKGKFTRYLGKGNHTFKVEFAKHAENASLAFEWYAWPGSRVFAADNQSDGPFDYVPASITTYLDQPASQTPAFSEPDQPVRELMDSIAAKDSDRALIALDPADRSVGKLLISAFQSATELNNAGGRVAFDEMEYSVSINGADYAIVTADGMADIYNSENELTDSRSFIFEIPVLRKEGSWYVSLDVKKVYELLKEYQNSQ